MKKVIIILSHKSGELTEEYKKRLDWANIIFSREPVENIILCGDIKKAREYLISKGIPEDKILFQTKSKDTIGEAFFTKKEILIPRDFKDLIIISSDYHIPRAKDIFNFILGGGFRIEYEGIESGKLNYYETINDQMKSLINFIELMRGVKNGDDSEIEKRIFEKCNLYSNYIPDYNNSLKGEIFVNSNGRNKMNILAIGAHFDDIELGCGGTIAKHITNGDNVTCLYITDGEHPWYNGDILRSKQIACEEGKNGMLRLGIKPEDIICLNMYEAMKVKWEFELVKAIDKIVEEKKIDTIYAHWDNDVNQDHFAIGKAAICAGRRIKRLLMYQSNWFLSGKQFDGRFYIDTTEFIEKKIAAIREHITELRIRGESWIDFVKQKDRNNGIEIGTGYAEKFEIIKYVRD